MTIISFSSSLREVRAGRNLTLARPAVVAGVKADSSVLQVSASAPNWSDSLGSKFCDGCRPSQLELSLLLVNGEAPAGLAVLVPPVPRYPHFGRLW